MDCPHDIATPLGTLGQRCWLRCRDCGLDFSVPAAPEPEPEDWQVRMPELSLRAPSGDESRLVVYLDDDPIGYVDNDQGCENPACHEALRNGRPVHAIPRGFAVTLPTYHFETVTDAVRAVVTAAMNGPDIPELSEQAAASVIAARAA